MEGLGSYQKKSASFIAVDWYKKIFPMYMSRRAESTLPGWFHIPLIRTSYHTDIKIDLDLYRFDEIHFSDATY